MGDDTLIQTTENPMTVTLTSNFTEVLQISTIKLIDELTEDNYELTDILEFIDENSEDDFVAYYEEYVEQGEKLGYNVVDSFVAENGFCDVEHCEEAYAGTFRDTDDFVEDLMESTGDLDNLPSYVVVDFQATWDRGLSYDYDAVTDKETGMVHVFRRYY
jgi:antirestriction protein